jgi:hypothetical protein
MARLRTFLLIFGGVFFFMSALHLLRFSVQRSDIWWTPIALSLPLAEVADRVEVYVRGVPLQDHIVAGRIQLLTDAGARPVTESDLRLRFNNWDRIRAQKIPSLLAAAVGLGASAVFLLFGLLDWGPPRRVPPPS